MQMPRDPFCAAAPKQDFLLHVDNAEACRQVFQDAAIDFGFIE